MVTAHAIPLSAIFFKEEIRLASMFSLETRDRPIPNIDFERLKENTQTLVISLSVETGIGLSRERIVFG